MPQMNHGDYLIDDFFEKIDFVRVHGWLVTAYWCNGISQQEIERAARNSSLVVGAYTSQNLQVGYMRVISDKTRIGYILDVFVDPAHRKKGLAKAMVRFALEHPDFKPVYGWLLATKDAHTVYSALGFKPLSAPEIWMALNKEKPSFPRRLPP